jgi:hypothetical protein
MSQPAAEALHEGEDDERQHGAAHDAPHHHRTDEQGWMHTFHATVLCSQNTSQLMTSQRVWST